MIDKKIYYCWFGHGEMSDLDKKCIESWKRCCPDYEIIEINENNYDYESDPYAKQNYDCGCWSGVSNAARLFYMIENSGFYLDTDVMLTKSLDELRVYDGGFITEFESSQPDSGVLGRGSVCPNIYKEAYQRLVPGTVLHKEFIQILYRDYDVKGEPCQTFDDGFTVLGEEYFPTVRTGLFTERTIGIHFFENTWTKTAPKPTDGFYPFPRMEVYFANRKIAENANPEVKLNLKNRIKKWDHPEVLGKTLYFFNPRVVKLSSRDFEAERITYDKLKPVEHLVTPSGMIVSYV